MNLNPSTPIKPLAFVFAKLIEAIKTIKTIKTTKTIKTIKSNPYNCFAIKALASLKAFKLFALFSVVAIASPSFALETTTPLKIYGKQLFMGAQTNKRMYVQGNPANPLPYLIQMMPSTGGYIYSANTNVYNIAIGNGAKIGSSTQQANEYSMVIAGLSGIAMGKHSIVMGGDSNQAGDHIGDTGTVVLGGQTNKVYGSNSSVLAGTNNTIFGAQNVIVAGNNNKIYSGRSHSVILAGQNNIINCDGCVVAGQGNETTSLANGFRAGSYSIINDWAFNIGNGVGSSSTARSLLFGIDWNGQLRNLNGVSYTSDARLKKEIRPFEYGLKEVLALNPVRYQWKSDDREDIGLIAQEVYPLVPDIVVKGSGDENLEWSEVTSQNFIWQISYAKVGLVLVNAFQEQQTLLAEISQENQAIKQRIENLKAQFNQP